MKRPDSGFRNQQKALHDEWNAKNVEVHATVLSTLDDDILCEERVMGRFAC